MTGSRTDYGIDAPGLVRFFLLAGSIGVVLAGIAQFYRTASGTWADVAAAALVVVTVYLLGMGCLMISWSRIIKLRDRERLLDMVDWRGDETVLDVGCGRGLMLIGAAHRVRNGRATGIDIWQASDQSANSAAATWRNARIEGVADRVTIETADMRALPFADGSFDVVMSHWAVHNLAQASDRELALTEMVRVLRPGGIVLLADIAHRHAYARTFAALGLGDLRRVGGAARSTILSLISFGSFRPEAVVAGRS